MFTTIKKLHQKIPPGLQKFYMPFVGNVSYHIQKIVNFIYPPVLIFEGLERGSKSRLTFVYVGFHPQLEHYWTQISLCEDFRKQDMGRHFSWNIFSFLKKMPFGCDFLLMEENLLTLRCFHIILGFQIPYWVSMELDISAPIEKLLGSQRYSIQRKIRKNKLSHVMTKDRKLFDDYYYNMFLPYIRTRHASTVHLNTYQELLGMFSRGGLILIKKEERIVAGALFEFVGQEVKLRTFGIREGKWEYVLDGALGAAYYFMVVEMKKQGYAKLFIGGARPFLNDGVTRHKILLDAYLAKDKKRSCLWLVLLRNSIGLKHFLTDNPFFFLDEKKDFYRAIFGEFIEGKLSQKCEDVVKSSYCGGLKEAFFFAFNGLNNDQDKNSLNKFPFVLKSVEDMIIK